MMQALSYCTVEVVIATEVNFSFLCTVELALSDHDEFKQIMAVNGNWSIKASSIGYNKCRIPLIIAPGA